ncbi:hypothetical protein XBJ2_1610040 [Xenorhabdus bovienii str. Jollieti]|uniref:Uncharacterized protein n=1 Tax=Xenorhabdus bovienii (strain SS-2004) TaxID=406818 RepID=D3V3J4_XENBS|nr:hypothetical protein XBJ1_3100 [Xenorhabdus bovienii SS-2004]CDH28083.1 hypothetical protein XBJ2_1610040 [Xenorhabdus bovienii str. Jollieti]
MTCSSLNATEPDDHLHQFHIYGKNYGISYSGGIAFPYNPYKITPDDFEFDVGDRFTYEYNFYVQIALYLIIPLFTLR